MKEVTQLFARTAHRKPLRFLVAIVWILFTISLLCWWMYFGLLQADKLSRLGYPDALESARFQRMLMWEGGTLILLILSGGCVGIYLLARELSVQGQIRAFFAAFTHEMRTSLSSLLIKAESFADSDTPKANTAQDLAADVERIRLQLDNALLATVTNEGGLHSETLVVGEVIRRVTERFSELSVAIIGDANLQVQCDSRALESILSNLFSNSLVHGKAGGVTVKVHPLKKNYVELRVVDDGVGFAGNAELLGCRFARHYEGSGAGLGLSISKDLAQRSKGQFSWEIDAERKFHAILILPRA